MKKTIIGLVLVAAAFSTNTYAGDKELALIAGLAGLAIIAGDGRASFGVHYNSGYYDYRGSRYSNRAAYLRAVTRYERERRYSQSYRYHPSFSSQSRFGNNSYQNNRSSYDRYDRDDRRSSNDQDGSRDRSNERSTRTNRN